MQCPPSKLFLCVWDSQGLFLAPLELPENWTDTRETLLEGVLFSLKYLGMTLVEQPKGEELSAAAVKRIVATVSTRSCRTLQNRPTSPSVAGDGFKSCKSRGKVLCLQAWEHQGCKFHLSGGEQSLSAASGTASRNAGWHWEAFPASPGLQGVVLQKAICVSGFWCCLISLADPGCGRKL